MPGGRTGVGTGLRQTGVCVLQIAGRFDVWHEGLHDTRHVFKFMLIDSSSPIQAHSTHHQLRH